MKQISLREERREVDETELRQWLEGPDGYRLAGAEVIHRKGDTALAALVFKKYEGHSAISIPTAALVRAEERTEPPTGISIARRFQAGLDDLGARMRAARRECVDDVSGRMARALLDRI